MKFRPQFTLRLMLLVVALMATIFAWRRAVWTVERPEQLRQLRDEYSNLANRRAALLSPQPQISISDLDAGELDSWWCFTLRHQEELDKINEEMNTLENRINELRLSPGE
jgi:hypothetical protein